jgi:hypothetical protein
MRRRGHRDPTGGDAVRIPVSRELRQQRTSLRHEIANGLRLALDDRFDTGSVVAGARGDESQSSLQLDRNSSPLEKREQVTSAATRSQRNGRLAILEERGICTVIEQQLDDFGAVVSLDRVMDGA